MHRRGPRPESGSVRRSPGRGRTAAHSSHVVAVEVDLGAGEHGPTVDSSPVRLVVATVPGRLRRAADRPPPAGDPGADDQGRRVGARALRRRLLQAAQLDVTAVHAARGHHRGRPGRVDGDQPEDRRHPADPAHRDLQRLQPRPRRRPRPAEGRRREAPPGAARRPPGDPVPRPDAGPPRVPDRDRPGRPDVSRRGRRLASPSRSSAAATSTASSSSPATSSCSTGTRC